MHLKVWTSTLHLKNPSCPKNVRSRQTPSPLTADVFYGWYLKHCLQPCQTFDFKHLIFVKIRILHAPCGQKNMVIASRREKKLCKIIFKSSPSSNLLTPTKKMMPMPLTMVNKLNKWCNFSFLGEKRVILYYELSHRMTFLINLPIQVPTTSTSVFVVLFLYEAWYTYIAVAKNCFNQIYGSYIYCRN